MYVETETIYYVRCIRCELDISISRQRPVVGFCENGVDNLGFMQGGKFLDQLSDYQLLKARSSSGRCSTIAVTANEKQLHEYS